ncbi:hypothetical protein SRHO_G00004360 [Serrasalmus rhombeus]
MQPQRVAVAAATQQLAAYCPSASSLPSTQSPAGHCRGAGTPHRGAILSPRATERRAIVQQGLWGQRKTPCLRSLCLGQCVGASFHRNGTGLRGDTITSSNHQITRMRASRMGPVNQAWLFRSKSLLSFQYQSIGQSPPANIDTEDLNVHFVPCASASSAERPDVPVSHRDMLRRNGTDLGQQPNQGVLQRLARRMYRLLMTGRPVCSYRKRNEHPPSLHHFKKMLILLS